MRPLPTSPTNTFQSPKVATSDGLDAASLAPDLGAGLVAASAGGRSALATQTAAAATPMARRDERTRRVIKNNPLNRAWALWPRPGGGLPCRPIRAKFRPSALPADAGAAILHLVTEKLVKLGARDESADLS